MHDEKKPGRGRVKQAALDWLKILLLLLDEAIAVVAVVFLLRYLKVDIPFPVAIAAALLVGAFVFIVHRAVIPGFRQKAITGPDGMIGAHGKVVEPLAPCGTVVVKGERWWATCKHHVSAGEEVEVVSLEGLTLTVRCKRPAGNGMPAGTNEAS